jgi:predicted DCC family thiol-disulfide oxidoreductase YuxK
VRFVLQRDRRDAFQFAALESEAAAHALEAHGGLAALPDSAVVVTDRGTPDERLLLRSDAIFFIADQLGQPWRLALLGALFPRFVRDFVYDRVAASRARLFGRTEVCMVPTLAQRAKFLES